MSESKKNLPQFERPPVYETRIGVQFAPLIGFRSGHFGLFWHDCLGTGEWRIHADQALLPKEQERFGSKFLRQSVEKKDDDYPQACMRLSNMDDTEWVLFQANKIIYGWKRDEKVQPTYSQIKSQFAKLFEKLERFAEKYGLSRPSSELWEISYVNKIVPGSLWQSPSDWHRVLPGIFPPGGPSVPGFEWATFNGTWFFEIPPQRGRVMVKAQKAVANQTGEILLLMVITARGEIGGAGAPDWSTGLDLGHQAAGEVFCGLSSSEAQKEWGVRL